MLLKNYLLLPSFTLCLTPFIALNSAHADVRLPNIISDNMVFQQDMPIPVWGWAAPNEEINITLSNNKTTVRAGDDGRWFATLPVMKAGGPFTMHINGKNTITVSNILIGEVWICSGQSNMDMGINSVQNAKTEVAEANYPQIRLCKAPYISSGIPKANIDVSWKVCSPETISSGGFWGGGFSGVAYFFGREIHKKTGIPVGLIDASWGGTLIEPWTPPEGFKSIKYFEEIVKEIEEAEPKHRQNVERALEEYEQWLFDARKDFTAGNTVTPPPLWPRHPLEPENRPTSLYNGMIHPIAPFSIRGAIWYQGESNKGDGMLYFEKMKALIQGWRTVWRQGDFPFYYVQIAPFDPGEALFVYGEQELPELWEAQTAALSIRNTGMVVTNDIGDLKDIHPKNKQDVGKRLALWALARTYGYCDIVYSGPLYKSMTVEGKSIRITFEHTGSGLTTRDWKTPDWFKIAGKDKNFYDAHAQIEDNTVIVSSKDVQEPVAVRFAWHRGAMPNLMNKEGLPASAFRTDSW